MADRLCVLCEGRMEEGFVIDYGYGRYHHAGMGCGSARTFILVGAEKAADAIEDHDSPLHAMRIFDGICT
ncbi:MAG: hypothetical protein ACE5EC_02730 [Phycisphaerae bacterium]